MGLTKSPGPDASAQVRTPNRAEPTLGLIGAPLAKRGNRGPAPKRKTIHGVMKSPPPKAEDVRPRIQAMREPTKNLLLTGEPACGKTTVVRRVVEHLGDLRLAGFYTQEVRRDGRRLGFQAIGFHGGRATLAHVLFASAPRVGRYGLDLAGFERIVGEEFGRGTCEVELFVIDEIGKMECFSTRFVDATQAALDGPVPVLATVGYKGRGFLTEVKTRRDIRLITVTRENRDTLPERLERELRRIVARRRSE